MGMIGCCCEVCWERDCNCTEEDRIAYRERHKNDPLPEFKPLTQEDKYELAKMFWAGVESMQREVTRYELREKYREKIKYKGV